MICKIRVLFKLNLIPLSFPATIPPWILDIQERFMRSGCQSMQTKLAACDFGRRSLAVSAHLCWGVGHLHCSDCTSYANASGLPWASSVSFGEDEITGTRNLNIAKWLPVAATLLSSIIHCPCGDAFVFNCVKLIKMP